MTKKTNIKKIRKPKSNCLTKTEITNALINNSGLIQAACNELKITRQTFYNYIKRFPELKQIREDLHEDLIDMTESKLLENIEGGNLTAIIFFLKTRARHRGYVENPKSDVPESDASNNIIFVEHYE